MNEENNQVRVGLVGIYIPGEVLFNPHLSSTEKLLFGFINNLAKSGKRGCFATNRYLGEFVDLIPTKVSLSIKHLLDFKYITVQHVQKSNQTQETERQIFIDDTFHKRYSKTVILINETIHSGNQADNDLLAEIFLQCKDGDFNSIEEKGGLSEKIRGIVEKDKQKEDINELHNSFFKKTKKELCSRTPEGVVLPYKRVKNSESKSSDVQGKNKTDKEIKKEEPSTSRGACEGYEKGSSISAATKDINADLKETQVKKSKEKEKPVNTIVPEHLKPFIAVWESQGFKLSDKKTQSFANSIHSLRKLVSGSLYKNTGFGNDKIKSYTLSDFIFGIERFKLTLTPDYYPLNKASIQRITLQDFLYNPFTTSKSLFLTMLHEEPKRVRPEVIDYNPTVTTQIISKYRKEVLNNLGYLPSTVDQSKFISAAAKLNTFFEVNSKSFPSLLKDTNKQVDLLWQSIEQETKGMRTSLADITPGFFCSDLTFSRRLPAYLAANGYIKKEGDNNNGKHFSIYR